MLDDTDDARVWKAINWKGDFSIDSQDEYSSPSDEDSKAHFETVLNPPGGANSYEVEVNTEITIPVLDKPPQIQQQVKEIKVDKEWGPDVLPPDVFSLLPA